MNEQAPKVIGYIDKSKHKPVQGKNYLFTIGIDKYADTSIPKLHNAVKDLERLEDVLTKDYDFLLHTSLTNTSATRTAIQDTLESLENVLTDADNLIIFFSGHGYRKGKTGYIVPVDGKNNSTTDYITFADLKARINELPMCHFLLILDCCYAGTALRNFSEQLVFTKPSRRILAACQPEETAQDGFLGTNSPFTEALTKILANNNDQDGLPVKTLFAELRTLMHAKGVRQVPVEGVWQMDSNENGEFVFRKQHQEGNDWQNAIEENTVAAFQNFREKYPLSIYGVEADKYIYLLQKEVAEKAHISVWDETKKENTAFAYLYFWQNNPTSPYKVEAWQLLNDREDDELWENTYNIPSRVINYLQTYPNGRHRLEAEAILKVKESQIKPEDTVSKPIPKEKKTTQRQLSLIKIFFGESKFIDFIDRVIINPLILLCSIFFICFIFFVVFQRNISENIPVNNTSHTTIMQAFEDEINGVDEITEGIKAYNSADYVKAFKLLYKNRFHKNFNGEANFILGWIYDNEQGVKRDFVQAVKWYSKAAEQGDVNGQFRLGVMYDNGYGVKQNYKEAIRWYGKSAEQGSEEGQCNLAIMYEFGQGIAIDINEAVRLYRLAAKQQNQTAKAALKRLGYSE